jgi:hypothetical protein
MSNYNFTIRATDGLGAYADRSFSMTVNNTNVDRFVITGSTGVAHSQTGLSGSWIVETGTFGENTEFVNGLWLNYGSSIKTSTDAATWNQIASSLPTSNNTDGFSWAFRKIAKIKFFKNKWYGYFYFSDTKNDRGAFFEYTSNDLVNWTFSTVVTTIYYSASWTQELNDVYYDAGTDTFVAIVGINAGSTVSVAFIWSKVGTGDWNKRLETNNSTPGAYRSGTICFINGQWCVNIGADIATGVYTSIDAVNFTNRPLPAFSNSGSAVNFNTGSLVYNDGYLLSCIQSSVGGQTGTLAFSLNGGRSWTRLSGATTVFVNGTQHFVRQWMASYCGVLIMVNGAVTTNTNSLMVSQNGGSTATSFNINPSLGSVYGVAARQT